MKICIISSRFYPQLVGSGTSAYTMAKELHNRGHEITVLTDVSLRESASHTKLGFSVKYVEALEDFAMGKAGFRGALGDLYSNIKYVDPDIIHVCNFMPMLLLTMIRPEIRCPVAFSFFNTPIIGKRTIGYFPDPILDTNLGSFIIKSDAYDLLIVGSQHYMDAARTLGASPDKLRLSYLAPDVTSFDSEHEAAIETYFPEDALIKPYILLPSRITPQKGIIEAIEALGVVNNSTKTAYNLLLTGMATPFDSVYASAVWDRIDELGIRKNVLAPKRHIDREHLAAFFKKAEMVIVPSWYEGLGLAAIEAQYLGVPLAVSDTTGLNEVVEDGKNGLTFEPRNSQSLANAMIKILRNEVDVPSMVRAAKKTVRVFSLDRHIVDLESAYKELIEKHRK